MALLPRPVWNDVLGQVRCTHPQLVRGWFTQLSMGGFAGGVLTVRTGNDAQQRYLSSQCRQAFTEAAQAATGRLVAIEFETPEPADAEPPATVSADRADLNADFTFEHFVTGPSNRLAHAAAKAIAESPGEVYNPLFLHGEVGLGKTHLIQAICHEIVARNPDTNCLYLSCDMFTNDFIESVEQGALHEFRYRYRQADVLVVDDVQFLTARERSQEEFFHLYTQLNLSKRQIILSSDCPPGEIPSLEARLVSRFNSGLVASMEAPCLDTRIAIVRKKARSRCIAIPDDVAQLIARQIDTNIRDLEGALSKIDAYSQAHSLPIDLRLARLALGDIPIRPVSIADIMQAVARRMKVKVTDLQGRKRSRAISQPRHMCMYLARELTGQSLEAIGGYFGGRDHTTVLHAHRTIVAAIEGNESLRTTLDELVTEVRDAR